ncbi:MAG: ABC transporter substrate-binding protein [Solobacterium sp.]|nr:ABC transporter substrate-binding protein [Solobacterium sp.]
MKHSAILKTAMAVTLLTAGACAADEPTADETTVYKVAVVKQLDHASLDEIAIAVTDEFDALAEENGITIEYTVYSGQNDQSVLQQIASQALADGVDAIIPIATLAAQTMTAAAADSGTPVIFAAVSDPASAELTDIPYVTGTSDALNTAQIMDMIFTADPGANTIGLLYSKSETNSLMPIEEAKTYLDGKGIDYVEVTGNTNDEIIQAASSLIAADVDAVFTPTDNVVMAAELAIAGMFAEAGIPHYAGADSFVRNGAFATCGVNYTELGKTTADIAFKAVSEGIDATGTAGSFEVMPGGIITVNTETADALGADPSVFASFGEVVEVVTSED